MYEPIEIQAPKHRRSRWLVLVIIVVLAAILVVGGRVIWDYGRNQYYWGTSDDVRVLLRDPMASATFEGLTLVATEQTPHIGLTEKTPTAYVTRWFRLGDKEPESAVRQVVEVAQSYDWTKRPETGDSTSWLGTKLRNDTGYDMSIQIAIEPSNGASPGHVGELRVELQYP